MQNSPQTFQRTFGAAHWALIFALALPLTVMLFGLVRARQFHAKLDSKWARSSPLIAFRSDAAQQEMEADEPANIPEPTEQDASDELPVTETASRSIIDSSHTGSASGHHSIDFPIRSNKFDDDDLAVAEAKSDRRAAAASDRNRDSILSAELLQSAGRLEAQVQHVNQSVDQLTRKLSEHRSENSQQQARILEQQNQLLDQGAKVSNAIQKLEEVTENTFVALAIDASARRHSSRGPHPTDEEQMSEPKTASNAEKIPSQCPPGHKTSDESKSSVSLNALIRSARTIPSPGELPNQFYAPIRAHAEIDQQEKEAPQPAAVAEESKETEVRKEPVDQPRVLDEFESQDRSIRIVREVGRDTVELYSINLNNADFRDFLGKLTEFSQIGIIPSPGVEGRITMHVQKRRLDVVLQSIAKSRDYVIERDRGIATIRTSDEVAQAKKRRMRVAAKPTIVR